MVHTSARFASVLSNTVNDLRQTPLGIDEIVRLRDMSVLERFLKYWYLSKRLIYSAGSNWTFSDQNKNVSVEWNKDFTVNYKQERNTVEHFHSGNAL